MTLFKQSQLVGSVVLASMLFACSSPPKPPQVGYAPKEAANGEAIDSLMAQKREEARISQLPPPEPPPSVLPKSTALTVQFAYNSTKFRLTEFQKELLDYMLNHGQKIKKVSVRGRTSGDGPTAGNEKVALERALAAKRYLVAQGVPAQLIAVNYMAAGDNVGSNDTREGRRANQRVDIQVFYE